VVLQFKLQVFFEQQWQKVHIMIEVTKFVLEVKLQISFLLVANFVLSSVHTGPQAECDTRSSHYNYHHYLEIFFHLFGPSAIALFGHIAAPFLK
jgi:hypothetical protein